MMLKVLCSVITVAKADSDLHLLQVSAHQQPNPDQLVEDNQENEDAPPSESDLMDAMQLEDHEVLSDLLTTEEEEERAWPFGNDDDELPKMNANGVYPDQRPVIRRGEIRGFYPNIPSMQKCQCKAADVKKAGLDIGSVIYHRGVKRCLMLKKSVDFGHRIKASGWSTTDQLACKPVMTKYAVPASCDGLRDWEAVKCSMLRGAAAYTYGSWIAAKKCSEVVSTNPKMYDWAEAKDYCLTGNSYCTGVAKKTVKKNGKWANEFTFCKTSWGSFRTKNMPASWPYGGVLEVRRHTEVELPDDAFDKLR